ncbi:hypothetical protein COBT_000621 [Conglomerata obtusa]
MFLFLLVSLAPKIITTTTINNVHCFVISNDFDSNLKACGNYQLARIYTLHGSVLNQRIVNSFFSKITNHNGIFDYTTILITCILNAYMQPKIATNGLHSEFKSNLEIFLEEQLCKTFQNISRFEPYLQNIAFAKDIVALKKAIYEILKYVMVFLHSNGAREINFFDNYVQFYKNLNDEKKIIPITNDIFDIEGLKQYGLTICTINQFTFDNIMDALIQAYDCSIASSFKIILEFNVSSIIFNCLSTICTRKLNNLDLQNNSNFENELQNYFFRNFFEILKINANKIESLYVKMYTNKRKDNYDIRCISNPNILKLLVGRNSIFFPNIYFYIEIKKLEKLVIDYICVISDFPYKVLNLLYFLNKSMIENKKFDDILTSCLEFFKYNNEHPLYDDKGCYLNQNQFQDDNIFYKFLVPLNDTQTFIKNTNN